MKRKGKKRSSKGCAKPRSHGIRSISGEASSRSYNRTANLKVGAVVRGKGDQLKFADRRSNSQYESLVEQMRKCKDVNDYVLVDVPPDIPARKFTMRLANVNVLKRVEAPKGTRWEKRRLDGDKQIAIRLVKT